MKKELNKNINPIVNIDNKPDNAILSKLFASLFSIIVILVSLIVLIGWFNGLMSLARFSATEVPMAPSTAYVFIILAVGVLFYIRNQKSTFNRNFAIVFATITICLSFCLVVLNSFQYYSNWEHLFIKMPVSNLNMQIGHMSLITALLFMISGLSLLFFLSSRKIVKFSGIILTLILFIISFTLLFGYILGSPFFYFDNFIPPAALTALSFLLVSLSMIFVFDKKIIFDNEIIKTTTLLKDKTDEALLNVLEDFKEESIELKKSKEALKKNDEILNRTGEMGKIGGWEFDLVTNNIVWTLETYHIHEIDLSVEPGLELGLNYYAPEARPIIRAAVQAATDHGTPYDLEVPFITAKGNHIWVRTMGSAVIKNGKAIILRGTFQDITIRKKAELALQKLTDELEIKVAERTKELRENNTQIETIIKSIGDGVFVVDKNYKIIVFNSMSAKICGIKVNEAIGKRYDKVLKYVYEESGKVDDKFIEEYLTKDKSAKMIHSKLIRKDGLILSVANSVASLKDGSGNIFGCVVVFRDETDIKIVDQMKSNFVSLASHQLRTPLTTIKLFVEMLVDFDVGKLNKKQTEYVKKIMKSNERMIQLINEMLNTCRLEAGNLRIEPEFIYLDDIIMDVIKVLKNIYKKTKLVIIFQKPKIKLSKILIDPILARQIIVNLLTNAIQYSDSQKCRIEVRLWKKSKMYQISVKDKGIGIPESEQARIFERYFRARNAVRHATEGTGMGLYFAKMVTDIAGGKIWFESEVGRGTTFYVSIPSKGMEKTKGGDVIE